MRPPAAPAPSPDLTGAHPPLIVSETAIADLLSAEDAFAAVRDVFAAMERREARGFPVIRGALGHADAPDGLKSGFDSAAAGLGLKSGGYWPGNAATGLTNRQSTIFLFDADTGRCRAVVGGNLLTALRTAAAVSVAHPAREDAKVLGIVGAGHQATSQLRQDAAQRDFDRVVAWNRTPGELERLRSAAGDLDLPCEAVSLEELGAQADVIVTIVSASAATLLDVRIRPGTHLARVGTDTKGKQEVEASGLGRASVFTGDVAQSTTIGEAQHAAALGLLGAGDIVELGAVINGDHPGRTTDEEITVFDDTGVGLQDLAVASAVVERAVEAGAALEVDF